MKKGLWKQLVFILTFVLGLSVITSIVFATSGLMAVLPDKGAR